MNSINIGAIIPASAMASHIYQPEVVTEKMRLQGYYPTRHFQPLESQRDKRVLMLKELDVLLKRPFDERFGSLFPRIQYLQAALDDTAMVLVDNDHALNIVPDAGANNALDTWLAASSFTQVAYLLLYGSVGYTTGPVTGDTMASHGGWVETGGATGSVYTGNRKTMAFNAASARSKALTTAQAFSFTTGGTVKGAATNLGASASATKDTTTGVLASVGPFTAGDKTPGVGDSLSVSFSMTA